MKLKATIEIELEAEQGTEGGLEIALLRGLVSLRTAMDFRMSEANGTKYGSGATRVEIVEKSIVA
jgi:hypothetical protein